jgi:MSHA biogenesis protein MshG
MAMYAWRGRNARGESVQGQIDALNEGAVAEQLIAIGVAPVHITVLAAPAAGSVENWFARFNRKPLGAEDILMFSRQMYTLSKAGVPILRAFAGLQASATKPAMVNVLKDIHAGLDQGRELSTSMAQHAESFGLFYLAMVKVGEMTGRLTEVFLHLAEHVEFERDVRERIKQALRYPMFVMIAMAIAVVIINIFVIPVFAKVFAGFHTELPLITRGLLAFSDWMLTWWPVLLGIGAASVALQRGY